MADEVHSRPEITAQLARGVTRMLWDHGLASVLEVPLANGRRADVMALTANGEIWIVETKSCLEDFAVDSKWPDYLDFCDRFFFGVTEEFPRELIPEDVALELQELDGWPMLPVLRLPVCVSTRVNSLTLIFH